MTARLLLDGQAGKLPLTRVTPEGYEDIDIEFSDNTRALVQVKERSPSVTFRRSDLAEALAKKSAALEQTGGCRFVLATDATLGEGLAFTGWDKPLSECISREEVERLAAQFNEVYDEPTEIISRTHILRIERNLVEESRLEFARVSSIHSSVAVLAYARLIEQVTEIAVRQRSATPKTAEWIAPSDLNTLVTRVLEAVNVESLDEAVRVGIVEPVDFGTRADLSAPDFLSGVDVLPIHIAADLDLPRPAEIQALTTALREQNSALLTGPSGSGKSALLWRTARELAGQVRPYRLLRLLPEDVPELSRWIRLQEPTKSFPLLLCADNLGRPLTAGWTSIAREFLDVPGVLLLGACREEDYRTELVVGRTTLVDPKLDREFASCIAEMLANSQVPTVLDVAEAFEASEGLLMEFLSMLLTGRRLRQVVEEQMDARLTQERATEREILRYVATAHAAGVPLPADVLGSLIPDQDLTSSLSLLDREHILVSDDEGRWQGLHELRSTIARDFLHGFPPPTIATTIRRLVEHLPPRDASRIIEVYARLDSDLLPSAEGVSAILNSRKVGPEDGQLLISSLAMADAFRHARECLRIVEDHRPKGLDPETALLLAYSHRFAGVSFDGFKDTNPGFSYLIDLADALPARPESLRDLALENLSSDEIRDISTRGTSDEAIAWLESLEGSVASQVVPTHQVWTYFTEARLEIAARLSATLTSLTTFDGSTPTFDQFGDFNHRIRRLANELPDCVGIESNVEPDGMVMTLRLLVPDNDTDLHDRSVSSCRLVLDFCPEADIAEVIIITADGDRHSTAGFEPVNKRISRDNLPRPPLTAVNAKFLRAGRLLLASRYWTEPIRLLADFSTQLLELREDSVSWVINPHHNARRRGEAAELMDSLLTHLAAGPREPVDDESTKDHSGAREALSDAVTVVRDVAISGLADEFERRRLGARCRSAVDRLMKARRSNLPRLATVGDPLPDSLDDMLTVLADVLLASVEPQGRSWRAQRKRKSDSWVEAARRFVDTTASSCYQAEKEAIDESLATAAVNLEIKRVRRADMKSALLLTDWWVLLALVEDGETAEDDVHSPSTLVDRLVADLAGQLAFRTFIVFSAAGRLLPLNAVKIGTSQFGPADEDELAAIASELGTEVMESIHLQACDSFIAALVEASRAATLFRLREQTGLPADESVFNDRLESARMLASGTHPLLQDEVYRLLDRVEGEPRNKQRLLAGEVYRSVTHWELTDDLNAISALRITALSIDLSLSGHDDR